MNKVVFELRMELLVTNSEKVEQGSLGHVVSFSLLGMI